MFKKILLGIVAIIIIFAIVVAFQPADFRIERSATMAAPPAAVFAQVNDFHNWQAWSPWAKLDPKAKNTFEGPELGVGAGFSWDGNNDVGMGRMTITESKPNELIRIKLEFKKPMEGTSTAEYTFQPEGEGTKMTWSMYGQHGFMGKVMCLIMNMDKTVGGQFEKGLDNIKTIVEKKESP